jgi:hypothetical protein
MTALPDFPISNILLSCCKQDKVRVVGKRAKAQMRVVVVYPSIAANRIRLG